ncbi:galactokinase-like protein [Haematococcus lacustris]
MAFAYLRSIQLPLACVEWPEVVQDLVYVARAPGRLDVMGGIADYSGALVLQMPVAEACHAAVQVTHGSADPHISVVSLSADQASRAPSFTCPTSALYPEGQPLSYEEACTLFKAELATSWAAYVVGCLLVLSREQGLGFSGASVSILVSSQVPEGKGVSSSAAVEVAVMQALLAACGQGQGQVPGRQLALLCQRVENLVVGAPCGIMDQMASALGEEGALLALLCQPAEVQGCVALPSHLSVWGVDSGLRHSVGGADYDSVRAGAFMGLKIGQQLAALPHSNAGLKGALQAGYLVGLSPSQFSTWLEPSLPESMTGQQFLALHGAHVDPVTRVLPEVRYAVRQPAAHPVHEHHRVRLFRQLLQAAPSQEQGLLLGELMLQSHASYSACGLGSHGTDRLVEMVVEHISAAQASGRMPLLFGAKITGGGSGGTVCILGSSGSEAEDAVQDIVSRYQRHLGLATPTKLFKGSSMGASTFGCLAVKLQ